MWNKKNLLDWHNQKWFPIPEHQWRNKAPATSKCRKWWEKALEDINSAHDVEYNGHVEEEELAAPENEIIRDGGKFDR